MYCPYCNKSDCSVLTNEHVIPSAIGGDSRTVIRVCSDCNSSAGSDADAALAAHSGLRFIAMAAGRKDVKPRRNEKHRSRAILKDGRELWGVAWIAGDFPASFHIEFEPRGDQDDGEVWASQAQVDNGAAPPGCKVLSKDMVEWTSFQFEPVGEGVEDLVPAMLKIMLGVAHSAHGQLIVEQALFNLFRRGIRGDVDPALHVAWVDPAEAKAPYPCSHAEHLVWGGCEVGHPYVGCVILFGRLAMKVEIDGLGTHVRNQALTIPVGWASKRG